VCFYGYNSGRDEIYNLMLDRTEKDSYFKGESAYYSMGGRIG